jgi:photosystem II stability/assembly factor-like uncharacterized protein
MNERPLFAGLLIFLAGLLATSGSATAAVGSWSSIGPDGAIVNAIVVNPLNPSIAYAATRGGGVFKTGNGGASWFPSNEGLVVSGSVKVWEIDALAIDAGNPSTIWAIAAEHYLFRSTDGAATWTYVFDSPQPPATGGSRLTVTVDSGVPTRVYVGGERWVARSIDGGASWTQIYTVPFNAQGVATIAIDPTNRDVIYLGLRGWSASKSTNGGTTWTSLPFAFDTFAVDPSQPQTVYAGYYGFGLHKSIDGGSNWTAVGGAVVDPYVRALVLDPDSPATLYVATDGGGFFKSIDSAANWNVAGNGITTPYLRSLALTPGRILLGANGGGIFASTDGAASWSPRNAGLVATRVQSLAHSGSTLFAGIYGANVFRRGFAANSWVEGATLFPSPDFRELDVAPFSPTTVYAATSSGLIRSGDGGDTWLPKTPPGATSCEAVAAHPAISSSVYAACFISDHVGVFGSPDFGDGWGSLDSGLVAPDYPYPPVDVAALAIDPSVYPGAFYAATNWGVYKSLNGGGNWSRLTGAGAPTGPVVGITIDRLAPQTLYVVDGYSWIYKTTDGGQTWSQTPLGWSSAVAIHPMNSAFVYAASRYLGVQKSVDGGQTWAWINSGLVNKQVTSLVVDPTKPSRIFAGIDAGGVFSFEEPAPTAFFTVTPCRVIDTREADGPLAGPALAAGNTRTFAVAGQCQIPLTAKSISANLTVTQPSAGGHLTVWPAGDPLPPVSSINYRPGQTRANNGILALNPAGELSVVSAQPSGSVQFILDVNGYFE